MGFENRLRELEYPLKFQTKIGYLSSLNIDFADGRFPVHASAFIHGTLVHKEPLREGVGVMGESIQNLHAQTDF